MTDTENGNGKKTRAQLLGRILAYTVVALPGAYSAVVAQYQAGRDTLAAVNEAKAREVHQLQEWTKANKAELEDLARYLEDRLRAMERDHHQDRLEVTRLLVQLARDTGRYRNVRAPDEPAPRRAPRGRDADLQDKLEGLLEDTDEAKPAPRKVVKRPALAAPVGDLTQVQRAM